MDPKSLSDAALAVAAVNAGAEVVGEMFAGPLERFEKSPGDFATDADLKAEQAILDILRAARPDDAVTGEESGRTGAGGTDRRWLVDPLCGTVNYAAGHLLAAVNVALRDGAGIAAAASADPATGEVFWTDGERAFARRDSGDETLRPASWTGLVDVNLDVRYTTVPGFTGTGLLADPAFAERFGPRVVSSTLAVAWVAAGRRAAYVTDGPMRDNVHFSSGIALCRAAGCVVTDLRGEPVGSGETGLIAAADRETHEALMAIVRRTERSLHVAPELGVRRTRSPPRHCHRSAARRALCARTLCRLPHRSIEHHRRAPGREESTNTSGQFSPAHSRMRSASGPESSSIISRASVDSACAACTGGAHLAVVPAAASSGASGAAAATRLMHMTAASGRARPAARACAVSQIAWRSVLAVASSSNVTGTVVTTDSGGCASHSPRSTGSWRVSNTAYRPSPPVWAKSRHAAPASNQNDPPLGSCSRCPVAFRRMKPVY